MFIRRSVLPSLFIITAALAAAIATGQPASAQTTSPIPAHPPVDHRAEQQYWSQRRGPVTSADFQAAVQKAHALPEVAQLPPSRMTTPAGGNGVTAYTGWTSVGPAPLSSPYGGGQSAGRLTSLAIDPTTAGSNTVIYVGSANGGLWKTVNNGGTWFPLTDKQITTAIGAVAIDPNDHNTIYAGTGEPNQSADSYRGFGVLKSSDGGNSWALLGNATFGNRNTAFNRIVIDPRTGSIYAAASNSLYVSSDGGVTWAAVSPVPTGHVDDLAINSTTNPSTLYATSRYHGLYRSVDGGTSWSILTTGLPGAANWNRSIMAMSPSQPNTIYVVITDGSAVYNLGTYNGGYYTNDGGNTWSPMKSLNHNFTSTQGWYAIELSVDPVNSHLLYGGGLDVWYSPDAQAASGNWVQSSVWYNNTSLHADQHNMAFVPGCTVSPCPAYYANDGGIYYSATPNTVTGTFVNLNTAPLAISEFVGGDLATNFRTTPLALGGLQDNGGNVYRNNSVWTEAVGGDGGFSQIDWSNTQNMYTEYTYAVIEKSTDGGLSFGNVVNGLPPTGDDANPNSAGALFYSPLVLDRGDHLHLATGAAFAVYETLDGAGSWYQGSQTFSTTVSAIGISPNNSAIVYAGLSNGTIYRTASGHSGASSAYVQQATPGGYISSITFDVTDTTSNTLFITTGKSNGGAGGIFKTIDGGTTWINITGTLPAYPINTSVVYYSGTTRVIVVGTDYGVYFTNNDGANWQGLNMGLPNTAVVSLAIDQAQTTIAAYTHGRSAWTIPIPTLGTTPIDTIGIYRPSTQSFYLHLHNSTGFSDLTVNYHPGTAPYPVVGDWTGSGYDTVGTFDQSNDVFTLCKMNDTALCASTANQISFVLGNPNDIPLSGRWTTQATIDTAGIFRPTNGIIYLRNTLSTGFADASLVLGNPADQGVAGDWTGKGYDTLGVYRGSSIRFYLSNRTSNGIIFSDTSFVYGTNGDAAITGDWVGQGHDGVGQFRQSNDYVYLRNTLTSGDADTTFYYGAAGDIAVAGHWQLTYPPLAPPASPILPAPVLIPKTATPVSPTAPHSAPGGNQIGG